MAQIVGYDAAAKKRATCSGCFEKIVMNATIIKGVILEPCVWVGNKNLEVVK
jgi:hypothetical protein